MPARMVASALVQISSIEFRVRFFSTTRQSKNRELKFAFLHDADNGRLVQKSFCTVCNEMVSQEHTVRGHEHMKDQYIALSDEDQKQLDALTPGTILIHHFVPSSAVDLLQIEKSFYLSPETDDRAMSSAAYQAFYESMSDSDLCAVGTYAAHRRTALVCIRARNGMMVLHQLRHASQVVPAADVPKVAAPTITPTERATVERLVGLLRSEEIQSEADSDPTHERVAQFLEEKVRAHNPSSGTSAQRATR